MKRSVRDLFRQRKFKSSTVLVMQGQNLVGLFAEIDYEKSSLDSGGTALVQYTTGSMQEPTDVPNVVVQTHTNS